MIVNLTGSFLIGLLMTLFVERWQAHPQLRLLLVVGFLGGYTTFSSFEYETYQAVREGRPLDRPDERTGQRGAGLRGGLAGCGHRGPALVNYRDNF